MTLFINGQKASIPQKYYASFHGHSVFTTLRSKAGALLYWPLHWQRLLSHASFFGFTPPPETEVLAILKDALTNKCDQKFRVIIANDHYAITCEDYKRPDSAIYAGVKAIISSFTVHPELARFKTGNSLPYFLAHKEALQQNAFEALLLDKDGFLADGSRTSLLMIKDGMIFSLTGGLDGCMRQATIMWAKERGVTCQDTRLKPHELNKTLLLANSLLGVVPVDQINCDLSSALVSQFRMDRS